MNGIRKWNESEPCELCASARDHSGSPYRRRKPGQNSLAISVSRATQFAAGENADLQDLLAATSGCAFSPSDAAEPKFAKQFTINCEQFHKFADFCPPSRTNPLGILRGQHAARAT